MADDTQTTTGDQQANGAPAPTPEQVQQAIDAAAAATMRPVSPLRTQREIGWNRLQKTEGAPIPCVKCAKPTLLHVNGICRECFIGGTDARPGAAPGSPGCGFCGRAICASPEIAAKEIDKWLQQGESLVRGGAGGVICSSCAASAAGAMGARNDVEARRMMATHATQVQAQTTCNMCLALAQQVMAPSLPKQDAKPGDPLPVPTEEQAELLMTLGEAAERFAVIARGGDPR